MKTKLVSALALLAMLLFCSCNSSVKRVALRQTIDETNKECPIDIEGLGTIDKIELVDNMAVMSFTLDAEQAAYANFERMTEFSNTLKNNMIMSMTNGSQSDSEMVQLLIDAECGLRFNIRNPLTEQHVIVDVSAEELAQGISQEATPMQILQQQVATANVHCPLTISEGITMTGLVIEGQYVVYLYECDDDYVDLGIIDDEDARIKADVMQAIENPDLLTQRFINACTAADCGMAYKYVGVPSGIVRYVHIEKSEILHKRIDF